MENYYTLVFDIGQFSAKIGYGGENEPRHTFYTMCGKPKYQGIGLDQEQKKTIYIGNEIVDHLGLYKITHPLADGGEIVNWSEFKAIIDYIFYLLRVDPSMCKILFTTNSHMSRESKKMLFELFLEEYTVGAYYPVRGALLTMYSGGFDTGLVVDMGAANIRITPIYKSYVIPQSVKFLGLGGNILDQFMSTKLEALGMGTKSSVQQNLVRLLKERACFTSLDYDADLQNKDKFLKEYALPDSSTITICEERFVVPELLFKPGLYNIESESIVEGIMNAIDNCDIDVRRHLLNNIFLTGGNSLIPFFEVRLKHEIEQELIRRERVAQNVRIIAPKGRVYSNWVGGSILSMIPEFQQNWINRKAYFEKGLTEELLDA